MSEPEQVSLFEVGEKWEEAWRGMPEFVQKDLEPYRTLYVHFEKPEDVQAFAKLVEQRISSATRFIWYPEAEIGRFAHLAFVDAPPPGAPVEPEAEYEEGPAPEPASEEAPPVETHEEEKTVQTLTDDPNDW